MNMNMKALTMSLLCGGSLALAADYSTLNSGDKYESIVLTFSKGSSKLNASDLSELKACAERAKNKGDIDKVEVAVWSDKQHPVKGDLAKWDRRLADDRITLIKDELRKQIGRMETIKTFNMAENSNWLGRSFHTDEAELDTVFAKNDSDALDRGDFNLIREDGAPRKAIIVFKLK